MLSNFEINVIKAVYYLNIENFKGQNVYPYPKTIHSFLAGKKASPFYYTVYRKYPLLCERYPELDQYHLSRCLDLLVNKGYLKESITPTKKVSYYITKIAKEEIIDEDEF